MLIGDTLRRQAAPTGRPHHPAIIHEGGATTFADLHAASTRVARTLGDLGTKPDDRVALLGRNSLVYRVLPQIGEGRRATAIRVGTLTGDAIRDHACG